MMELATFLHGRSLQSSPTFILPSTWCLDLCSCISLEENNLLCLHTSSLMKLDKVPELLRDSLMPDSSIP
jgi:hypothetical protein